ncbi:MAG: hypothetical protein JNL11_10095 [Bdellovibrionaceae bacterium]|nr:hypothetical protein [Pseudobdellovibrionaceae bacterium]
MTRGFSVWSMMLLLVLVGHSSFASTWKRIKIPGAKCGNGSPYSVFVRDQDPSKLVIEFMGGGACWDQTTCLYRAWIYPVPMLKAFGALSDSDNPENPFIDHTNIYFPYCTGDVFAGDYIGNYKLYPVTHMGHTNVRLAIQYLAQTGIINFKAVNDLALVGSSAGAIGTLLHAKYIETFVHPNAKKTLIADSPGLHFGPRFWSQFSADAKTSFKKAFNDIGLKIDYDDGFVARRIKPVLNRLSNWKIGFLYGEKDQIMSEYFGLISKEDHKKLLLSEEGLVETCKSYPNTKMWLYDSDDHIFLLFQEKYSLKSMEGSTAIGFVKQVYGESH